MFLHLVSSNSYLVKEFHTKKTIEMHLHFLLLWNCRIIHQLYASVFHQGIPRTSKNTLFVWEVTCLLYSPQHTPQLSASAPCQQSSSMFSPKTLPIQFNTFFGTPENTYFYQIIDAHLHIYTYEIPAFLRCEEMNKEVSKKG